MQKRLNESVLNKIEHRRAGNKEDILAEIERTTKGDVADKADSLQRFREALDLAYRAGQKARFRPEFTWTGLDDMKNLFCGALFLASVHLYPKTDFWPEGGEIQCAAFEERLDEVSGNELQGEERRFRNADSIEVRLADWYTEILNELDFTTQTEVPHTHYEDLEPSDTVPESESDLDGTTGQDDPLRSSPDRYERTSWYVKAGIGDCCSRAANRFPLCINLILKMQRVAEDISASKHVLLVHSSLVGEAFAKHEKLSQELKRIYRRIDELLEMNRRLTVRSPWDFEIPLTGVLQTIDRTMADMEKAKADLARCWEGWLQRHLETTAAHQR